MHLARRIEGVTQVDRGIVRLKGIADRCELTPLTRDGWDPADDESVPARDRSRSGVSAALRDDGLSVPGPGRVPARGRRPVLRAATSLVADLVARLDRERVLFVIGPSGSGKSSVVRAGLIPAVQAGSISGSEHWPVALFSPRADPTAELAHQLRRLADGVPASGRTRRGVVARGPARRVGSPT